MSETSVEGANGAPKKKKKKFRGGTSPSVRSKNYLIGQGYVVDKTERWQELHKPKNNGTAGKASRPGVRIDLFGIIDMIGLRFGECLGVQTTHRDRQSDHIKKALAEPQLRDWLMAGCKFEVHGWDKTGVGNKARWNVTITRILASDLPPPTTEGPSDAETKACIAELRRRTTTAYPAGAGTPDAGAGDGPVAKVKRRRRLGIFG